MKLKRWAVTVMDNWTPTRTFWTFEGACQFAQRHSNYSHIYQWREGHWQKAL